MPIYGRMGIIVAVIQSLSCVWLFVTPWTVADQAPLSSTFSLSCSYSCPLSQWFYLTISSYAIQFSFCLQSFPASGSFLVSQYFAWGGQSIGASASASVLAVNIWGWFPLGLTGLIGTLKSLLQHHNSKASILWHSAFSMVQLSHPYMTTGKNHSFDYTDLCQQSDVSSFKYAV